MNNTTFDSYLQHGCGRCEHYQTPQCKVHLWTEVLEELRAMLLEAELEEQIKWGTPCYMLNGKNIIMLSSFRESCALSFLKGAALTDEHGLLELPGPNTRYARVVRFRTADEVRRQRAPLVKLIQDMIAWERSGAALKLELKQELPDELSQRLEQDPQLAQAFEALTPGRQRSHIIYISGAKQDKTRARRVEQCAPKILAGLGFHDRLPSQA